MGGVMEALTRNTDSLSSFLNCTQGWFESCVQFLKELGLDLKAEEASGGLLSLLEQSQEATADFWENYSGCQPVAGLQYRVLDRGPWPLIFGFDAATQELKAVFPLIDASRLVPTYHALTRFIKYKSRSGKYYANRGEAEKEMFLRLLKSYRLNPEELRNAEEKQRRYGNENHFYAIEEKNQRAPLVFVLRYSQDKKGRRVVIVITCYTFRGARATRTKPKSRDSRAAEKRAWKELVKK